MMLQTVALLSLVVAQQPPAPKMLPSFQGHTGEVCTVVFSPDGKRLASASHREVKVWDLINGKELLTHQTNGSNVYGLAYSPDGKKIAFATNKSVRIFDAMTGQTITTLTTPLNYVFRLAYSPCGKYLAGAGGLNDNTKPGHVHLWELATNKETKLEGHSEAVLAVGFSNDGKYLVSGSGFTSGAKAGEVRLWQMPDAKNPIVLSGHEGNVYGVAVTSDGRRVVSGSGVRAGAAGGQLKLWDTSTSKELMKFEGHTGIVYGVAFSPDGRRIVSAGADKTLRMWSALTGKEQGRVEAHTSIIYSIAFHPDGRRVATAGQDRVVKVWEVGGPARIVGAAVKPEQLEAFWKNLSLDNADGYQAVWSLTDIPAQSLPLFRKHLKPAADLDDAKRERVVKLVRDLDNRRFVVREAAGKELATMGEGAIPHLKQALQGSPSLDLQRRVNDVLSILTGANPSPELMQALRAVEVLEHIGTPEAKQLLEKLAAGLQGARLTEDARASLSRLAKR